MGGYFDEYDKKIFKIMNDKDWWIDKFKKRKLQLIRAARKIHSSSSVPTKVGGVLLWQQVTEQFLKEITQLSITYVKAEIWPSKVDLKVDYERKTFGQIIDVYKNLSLDYEDRPRILEYLAILNKNRNLIVHKMFEDDDLSELEDVFESSYNTQEDLLPLLLDHYILICRDLENLKSRVDWDQLEKE